MATREVSTIGQRLKETREAAKLSQQTLATFAGLSVSLISQIERGNRADPHISTIVALANALNVNVSHLIPSSLDRNGSSSSSTNTLDNETQVNNEADSLATESLMAAEDTLPVSAPVSKECQMRASSSSLNAPLKWHGGKHYLAARIVALMPQHLHFVEPFFGGGAVLLNRNPDDESLWLSPHKGVSEVANDINGCLVNFWRVLRGEDTFLSFLRKVQAIPLARPEWETAHAYMHTGSDPVVDAVNFFVDCRQSRSGLMKGFTPVTRSRVRRSMNGNVSEWLSSVDGLPEIHARLRRVLIEKLPAVDLIQREDTPGTLFYCDPPYLHETRSSKSAYRFEMVVDDHQKLLDVLRQCKGKVMLSGYPSELYDRVLSSWSRHAFDLPNNAAVGKQKARETEVVWCNF